MEFLLLSSLIEGQSLSLISGSNSRNVLVLVSSEVQLIIHKLTARQKESIRYLRMLRACVISFLEKWDECLTLAEFSYNNSYQESIRMAPFEALYGKKCRTPLNWVEVGDHGYFGPDLSRKLESKLELFRAS